MAVEIEVVGGDEGGEFQNERRGMVRGGRSKQTVVNRPVLARSKRLNTPIKPDHRPTLDSNQQEPRSLQPFLLEIG